MDKTFLEIEDGIKRDGKIVEYLFEGFNGELLKLRVKVRGGIKDGDVYLACFDILAINDFDECFTVHNFLSHDVNGYVLEDVNIVVLIL